MGRRVAVYDLGSSSFHLLVCDVCPGGRLHEVARHRATLDLGVALGASGGLPHDRLLAAGRALRRLRRQLVALEPDVVVALGTAALRDAANRDEVLDHLARAAGTGIRVLDGPEEARLCFVGQLAAVWNGAGPVTGLDLGGGSLELAVGGRDAVLRACSVPVGATRLRGELGDADPVGRAGRAAVGERVGAALAGWGGADLSALGADPGRVLASGGTVRTLARLATAHTHRPDQAARVSVNQVELPADQVRALAERLVGSTLEQRHAMPGMPRRRAASIAWGAAVIDAVVDHLGIGRLVVSEWGLREGAILDAVFA